MPRHRALSIRSPHQPRAQRRRTRGNWNGDNYMTLTCGVDWAEVVLGQRPDVGRHRCLATPRAGKSGRCLTTHSRGMSTSDWPAGRSWTPRSPSTPTPGGSWAENAPPATPTYWCGPPSPRPQHCGLFECFLPVGDHLPFHEASRGCAALFLAAFLGPLGGAFVFDVADRQPQ